MQTPNGLLYVCQKCGAWAVQNPATTLDGCSRCGGQLHHVSINMAQYNGWSEEIQQAFQYNYLIGKYTGGVAPVPGLTPKPPVARTSAASKTSASHASQAKPARQKKGAGFLGAVGSLVLRVLIGIAIFYLFTGGANFLSKFNGLQRKADTSVNSTIAMFRTVPQTGSYVSLDARWVAGPFAWETSTYTYSSRYSSDSGLNATVSETKYFYVILDDGTVMAIKTTNAGEIETLTRMSEWLQRMEGFPYTGEMLHLQGKLQPLDDAEIRSYYDRCLNSYGLASGTPNIRYLVLDTTAGREMIYIIIGGAVLVLVILLVVNSSRKKKKKKLAAAA